MLLQKTYFMGAKFCFSSHFDRLNTITVSYTRVRG